MSLHDVLLSLLREPMSGTDLIGLFRATFKHFWQTDLSQIYRALEALDREGCVRSESVPSRKGPSRKVYRLTREGRRRLTEWLAHPAEIPPAKFEYLAQLFSATADPNPRERARALLSSMRAEAARAVEVLRGIDAAVAAAPGYPDAMPAHLFYPWLTLRHGLLRRQALLTWIEESLERLDRRPPEADADAGPEHFGETIRLFRQLGEAASERSGAPREKTR